MRHIFIIPFLCFLATCYASKITSIDSFFTEAKKDDGGRDFRLPAQSNLKLGTVKRHVVQQYIFSYTLFVVGDDDLSRAWLYQHAHKLKNIHALGLVTNIKSEESLTALEDLAGMPLLPVNIDELSILLAVEHYPFVWQQGMVWQ